MTPQELLERAIQNGWISSAYMPGGRFQTVLPPHLEDAFQQAVMGGMFGQIPHEQIHDPQSDYDYRGFFQALMTHDPRMQGEATSINPNDNALHYTDLFKTPYHHSFSNESQYANPERAPQWNARDQLINPQNQQVVFDEPQQAIDRLLESVRAALHFGPPPLR